MAPWNPISELEIESAKNGHISTSKKSTMPDKPEITPITTLNCLSGPDQSESVMASILSKELSISNIANISALN